MNYIYIVSQYCEEFVPKVLVLQGAREIRPFMTQGMQTNLGDVLILISGPAHHRNLKLV